MKYRNVLITVGFLLGGIIGVCLIRAFFLDPIEQMGWTMFWEGLGHGELMNLGAVVQSATFLKCIAGFLLVGAVAGSVTYFKWKNGSHPLAQANKQ